MVSLTIYINLVKIFCKSFATAAPSQRVFTIFFIKTFQLSFAFHIRSSRLEVFCKKVFLEISKNSQVNTCATVSFLIKLQASGLRPSVFLWIYEISKNTFLQSTSGGCLCHIKISYLISSANQMTSVFMKSNTRLKFVRVKIKKLHSPATKYQITVLDFHWSFLRTP